MLDVLKYLNELQLIDLQIDIVERARDEEQKRLCAVDERIKVAKRELEEINNELSELEKNQRNYDGNLSLEEERLKKSKAKVNVIRNNEELRALQLEIEERKRIISSIEEENLGLLEKVEKKSKEQEKKNNEIANSTKEYEKISLKVEELNKKCNARIEEQAHAKKEIEDKIALPYKNKYRQLKNRNRGKAVVAVKDSVCQGCYMGIPPQIYNEIQKGEVIHFCPSCQRFLFYWEEDRK